MELEPFPLSRRWTPAQERFFPLEIYGDKTLSSYFWTRFLVLRYKRCRHCGLVFINPLPSFSDVDVHSFDGECNIVAWREIDWDEYAEDKLKFIGFYYKQLGLDSVRLHNRVLDVSCGPGVTLDYLRKKGWEVTGVDPDRFSQRKAREVFGLEIHNGLITDLDLPGEYFDLIIMDNSLEHYFDPLSALLTAFRLLRKGGALCIVVPNSDGLSTSYCGQNLHWGHWYAYCPKTLSQILHQIGFLIDGLIADQGGVIPQQVVDLGVDTSAYIEGLSYRFSGPETAAKIAEKNIFADYFSIIAVKPDTAPVESVRKSQLGKIAEQSKRQCSQLAAAK